ncbi:hypothetical protein RvY_09558 [Ramazzottius varieornatus]|uniref:Uncharacterized protein n=1 Tax=Ramazzottius varieornatus TaxID=947166 RepID=A0A1D1V9S6_RAMVA|nr:hypothetical protein RvY_09558 [Ramazzottius varieornatus]
MEEGVRATCSDWSPFRPFVFAVGTSFGDLLFYDVLSPQSGMRAAVSVKVFPSAITSLKFNKQNSDLIAVTGSEGSGVWKVPEILSESGLDERENFTKFVYQRES